MMFKLLPLIAALSVPVVALAEMTPRVGTVDPRVRTVPYNKMQVTKIITFYGVTTHIELESGEKILAMTPGDSSAWDIQHINNHIFVKPIADKPENAFHGDTNFPVVTDRRTYNFALTISKKDIHKDDAWRGADLMFSIIFNYPEVDALKEKQIKEAREKERENQLLEERLNSSLSRTWNLNYWGKGSENIFPSAVRDDGTFVHIEFNRNKDFPAVFEVNEKGEEMLVNSHVIGNEIIIEHTAKEFVLRLGDSAVSVLNNSYIPGKDNKTGTVSSDVVREIK